jgi:D-glycerate 3-kinase
MSDALRAILEQKFPDEPTRVARYYLPVCTWIEARAREGLRVVALNGPQGVGKSTLCAVAVEVLGAMGLRAVTVSIDDFYLPHDAQCALAQRHPGNPYLEHRGYPGTHDVSLGANVLQALRDDDGRGVRIPVYDKSAHEGRGDRTPEAHWPTVHGPFDLVLFEGWMLGFTPVPTAQLPDPRLAPCNEALRGYELWHRPCDAFVHLLMANPSSVIRWRIEAERARRATGAPGLSDEAVRDYVLRFIPAYTVWVPALRKHPPVRGPRLTVLLDDDRIPLEITTESS